MSSYLVHKACEVGKCKTAVRKVLSQPGYIEQEYRAFAKYDGCCAVTIMQADGTISHFSRTGEPAALSHLDGQLRLILGDLAKWHDGIVLLSEAWWPGRDQFPEISGAFRRHAGDDRLRLVITDYVTDAEFREGISTRPFNDRFDALVKAFSGFEDDPYNTSVGLADEWQSDTYITAKALAEALVGRGGYDGLIMRNPTAGWTKGHSGNDGAIIKVKHRVSIDVRCTGMVEGKGKQAGMVGALTFNWQGKHCEVGTGLSDDERKLSWENPVGATGHIFEVECLGFTPDGKPREPSFKGWRHDKLTADDE